MTSVRLFRARKTTVLSLSVLMVCIYGACDRQSVNNRDAQVAEQSRVTSPNGQLDAVLVQDSYGGAAGGGVESDVYIVRQGAPVHKNTSRKILQAEPFTDGKLIWKQDHLLEIHYDMAHIEQFRNLWGLWEVEDVGTKGEHDYEVEIRLEPVSGSFSVLTPEGAYRRSY